MIISERTQAIIDSYKKDLKRIVRQLEFCGYENEAGVMVNNVAFVALKQLSEESTNE
jgi:hypothetical protein